MCRSFLTRDGRRSSWTKKRTWWRRYGNGSRESERDSGDVIERFQDAGAETCPAAGGGAGGVEAGGPAGVDGEPGGE